MRTMTMVGGGTVACLALALGILVSCGDTNTAAAQSAALTPDDQFFIEASAWQADFSLATEAYQAHFLTDTEAQAASASLSAANHDLKTAAAAIQAGTPAQDALLAAETELVKLRPIFAAAEARTAPLVKS